MRLATRIAALAWIVLAFAGAYAECVSALDKAIQKGTLHENTGSRYKSRLSARVAAMK